MSGTPDVLSLSGSAYWDGSYQDQSLETEFYLDREGRVLRWVEELAPPGARVLDVGCGAGRIAIVLAERGYDVHALDASEPMVELARKLADERRVAPWLGVGDAQALEHPDGSFDVVLGIGVLPWVDSPARCAAELARVLRPGGFAIATADNPTRLDFYLDPRFNPLLVPVKRAIFGRRRARFPHKPATPAETDRLLESVGLVPVRRATVGFGPFTLGGVRVVPERPSRAVHRHLQRLADRGVPGLRLSGRQYLVLARKR
jgi:SAM-dependent methyltransferase